MFQQNGIHMSKEEIECFFDLCKTQSKYYLNFEEFKKLYNNPDADKLFRFYIKRARQINQNFIKDGIGHIYLPFNLSRLLEHMSLIHRREAMLQRIDENWLNHDTILENIKNFIKLFIIDKGSIETISKDEWSKKINFAIKQQLIKEKEQKGHVFSKGELHSLLFTSDNDNTTLKRLDSFHLNQLTKKIFETPRNE